MRCEERLSRFSFIEQRIASSVAQRAGLDFSPRRSRNTPERTSRVSIHHPLNASTLVQPDGESFLPISLLIVARLLGPLNVLSAGTMARLARHIDVGPRRGELAIRWIIVLLNIRRVAFRTHAVPVLTDPCPMQLIRMAGRVVRREMEPSLATLFFGSGVPGDAEGLKPPA